MDFSSNGFDDLAIGVPGEDIGTINASGATQVLYGSVSGLVVYLPYFSLFRFSRNSVETRYYERLYNPSE